MSTTKEPDYKAILFALCASLSIEDNMGDVWGDVVEALQQAGIPKSAFDDVEEFSDIIGVLPKPVKSLWGNPLEEDEQ